MGEAKQERDLVIDPKEFRQALGRFASGVTVVTTVHEDQMHGMTANAFVSVSLNPPLVLVSVDHRARMHELLAKSRRYGVSVLAEDQASFSQHFAGRPDPELEVPLSWRHGVPVIEGSIAALVCDVVDVHPAGDHTLYIGEVKDISYREGTPLIFYTGSYRNLQVHVIEAPYWW